MILSSNHLINKHVGEPIIVMGAGKSLPFAMEKALAEYPDAILISCNHRAMRDYKADYAVCFDKETPERIRKIDPDIPIISHFPTKGTTYLSSQLFDIINSGVMGVWLAKILGGYPIILCGLDFYQGISLDESPYYDNRGNVRDNNKTKAYAEKCKKRVLQIIKDRFTISYGGYLDGRYYEQIPFKPIDAPKNDWYYTQGVVRGVWCSDVTEVNRYEWDKAGNKWKVR